MCILLYALMCWSIWVKSGEEWVKSCCELFTPANLPVYRYSGGLGEEWRVFPCLLPHNIYRSGLWYDNPFAWFLRAFSADDMIFLHLLEMLKDGTSIDVQSVSNLSRSDIPIAGDKLQNGISRFWTTFLFSGPPFWTTSFFLFVLFFILQRYDEYFDFARKNGG